LCKHIARGKEKYGKNPRDPIMSRVRKYASRIVSGAKLGKFLDNFKIHILGNFSEQLDTLRIHNK